ncbi:hypothetical protein AVEN_208137-1 [Araneus ventricosus]|uniref:Uncharacterized protein n=1 Tax=Araneus ventricosus TaxID=182803 RepID=A0A4Y2PEA4_ARAVE|nr:hypothetical protein AVEN_230109-1 [Araneus ventricosus]GBN50317.1 hypothetical protein AVEN_63662-1 [Araneus ventricosus]GBN50338.1 hypothetical protein AVEN_116092-1 [Araneus ventricosus]GBN50369.1 hypothetical protein AVEN_208137-1 [Araneus ventricosus]
MAWDTSRLWVTEGPILITSEPANLFGFACKIVARMVNDWQVSEKTLSKKRNSGRKSLVNVRETQRGGEKRRLTHIECSSGRAKTQQTATQYN